jgi:N-acetyl-anhydromuramyl-L-alanine amidase AmpD
VSVRGWSDIGYHYLVQRDGVIRLGRPEWRIGAHVRGHNKESIGIAVIGNFEETAIGMEVEQQIHALRQLLLDLLLRYPPSVVKGHRQYAATLCPGGHLSEWLERSGLPNEASDEFWV